MKQKVLVIGFAIADAILIGVNAYFYLNTDRIAPVITFGEEEIVYREGMSEEGLLEGVTAMDDRDGDVTDSLVVEKVSKMADGDVIVSYAAMDRAGNVVKKARSYRGN